MASSSPSKAWPISALLLRLLTIIFLLVPPIDLATDSFTSTEKRTVRFNRVNAYRYVLSLAVIGCAYTVVWIPFAVYHVANGKPVSVGLPPLNLSMDVVMALVLSGAGFGLALDAKRYFDPLLDALAKRSCMEDEVTFSKVDNFFDKAYVSAGFMLAATVAMAALVIGSSLALAKKS